MGIISNKHRHDLFTRVAFIFDQLDQSPIALASDKQRSEAFVKLFKTAFKVLSSNTDICLFNHTSDGLKISYMSVVGGNCKLTYPHGLLSFHDPLSTIQISTDLKAMSTNEYRQELSRLSAKIVEHLKSPNTSFESPLNGDAILNYTIALEKQFAHMHIENFIRCIKECLIVMEQNSIGENHYLEIANFLNKESIADETAYISNTLSDKFTSDGKELFEIRIKNKISQNETSLYLDYFRHQLFWINENNGEFYPPLGISSISEQFKDIDAQRFLKSEQKKSYSSLPTLYGLSRNTYFDDTLQFIYANGYEITPSTLTQHGAEINKFLIKDLMSYQSTNALMNLIKCQVDKSNLYKTLKIFNQIGQVFSENDLTILETDKLVTDLIQHDLDFDDVTNRCTKPENIILINKCDALFESFIETELYCAIKTNKLVKSLGQVIDEISDPQDEIGPNSDNENDEIDTLSL